MLDTQRQPDFFTNDRLRSADVEYGKATIGPQPESPDNEQRANAANGVIRARRTYGLQPVD